MIAFLKESWFNLLLLALFVALTSIPVARPAGIYLISVLAVGYLVLRERAPSEGPRKWTAFGRALKAIGPAFGLLVAAQALWQAPFRLGLALSVFVGIGALGLYNWGDQLTLPDAFEVMRRDPRPPILFLRSFKEETRRIYDAPVGEREEGVYTSGQTRQQAREQELAKALDPVGPFVAIGRPGEPLASLGAARVYLGDRDWKRFVDSMVRFAAAVVLQPEFTPGTLWEVGLVVKTVDLRRLLLIVPDPAIRPFRYERVRGLVAETFGAELPAGEGLGPCDAFFFDLRRRPVPIRLQASEGLRAFAEHVGGLGPPGGLS